MQKAIVDGKAQIQLNTKIHVIGRGTLEKGYLLLACGNGLPGEQLQIVICISYLPFLWYRKMKKQLRYSFFAAFASIHYYVMFNRVHLSSSPRSYEVKQLITHSAAYMPTGPHLSHLNVRVPMFEFVNDRSNKCIETYLLMLSTNESLSVFQRYARY